MVQVTLYIALPQTAQHETGESNASKHRDVDSIDRPGATHYRGARADATCDNLNIIQEWVHKLEAEQDLAMTNMLCADNTTAKSAGCSSVVCNGDKEEAY